MKKMIWSIVIGLLLIAGSNIDEVVAQSPPNIKVSLALTGSRLVGRLLYITGDPITMVLTLKNDGGEEITSEDFSRRPFYLFLTFTDPDGRGIIAKKLLSEPAEDTPPPPIVPVGGKYLQVEPVDTIPATWVLTFDIPNAHAYYDLLKPGNYSVKAIITMRTYPGIDHTVSSVKYSEIDRFKWQGHLESNPVHFTLLADADGDGYYYPEAFGTHPEPDCNDNDPNEHPGQIWYKDADNDGYSDGTTDTTSCTRPLGYKTASELNGHTTGDCDDDNPNRNPGRTEVACNGIDDDCNPATPDFPAPTLASPANGATNVSTTPTLSWNAVSCATSYGLQVATDANFSSLVIGQASVTGTSFTVNTPLLSNGTYYWHVNGKKSGETSAWSTPTWSFTTVSTAPAAPTLVSPADGATGVSITPTLSWNASSGATSYRLQVSTSQTNWTGSNLKVNQSGITDTSKAVSGLANDTLYYWRVNATNAAGTSGWSSIWSFRTAKKTYLLTVTKAGTGSGDVSASPLQPPLIWNGNVGTATYDAGTKVTLTATANSDSTFTGWSASCSGTGSCSTVIIGSKVTVNMCGPCKATATFRKK